MWYCKCRGRNVSVASRDWCFLVMWLLIMVAVCTKHEKVFTLANNGINVHSPFPLPPLLKIACFIGDSVTVKVVSAWTCLSPPIFYFSMIDCLSVIENWIWQKHIYLSQQCTVFFFSYCLCMQPFLGYFLLCIVYDDSTINQCVMVNPF